MDLYVGLDVNLAEQCVRKMFYFLHVRVSAFQQLHDKYHVTFITLWKSDISYISLWNESISPYTNGQFPFLYHIIQGQAKAQTNSYKCAQEAEIAVEKSDELWDYWEHHHNECSVNTMKKKKIQCMMCLGSKWQCVETRKY